MFFRLVLVVLVIAGFLLDVFGCLMLFLFILQLLYSFRFTRLSRIATAVCVVRVKVQEV